VWGGGGHTYFNLDDKQDIYEHNHADGVD